MAAPSLRNIASGCEETLKRVTLAKLDVDAGSDDAADVNALGTDQWHPLAEEPGAAQFLSAGHGYFSFTCTAGDDLPADARALIPLVINLTRFDDEEKENGVPTIDASDDTFMAEHQIIATKAIYALPGVDPSKLTAELLSSVEYHEKCQPGPPTVEDNDVRFAKHHMVRFKKSIIPVVFSVTVQLAVSVVSGDEALESLAGIDGRRPTHAVLMERTKRDVNKQDSTVKCKSLLLYHAVDGGVVCTNVSVVINSGIPSVVGSVLDSFGSSGAAEVKETMTKSRRYLIDTIGDARRCAAPANDDGERENEVDAEKEDKVEPSGCPIPFITCGVI